MSNEVFLEHLMMRLQMLQDTMSPCFKQEIGCLIVCENWGELVTLFMCIGSMLQNKSLYWV